MMDDGRSMAMSILDRSVAPSFWNITAATGTGVRDAEEEEEKENWNLLLIMKKSDLNAKRMQKK